MASSEIAIRQLEPASASAWDEFVRGCPEATFFHLSGWRTLFESVLGHRSWYLYAEQDGKIIAVLPLAQVKSRIFGNQLASLPFCVYGGVAGAGAACTALEQHADDLARRLGVDYLEYRNVRTRHSDWPVQDLYQTFRKAIEPDDEANLMAIPRKQRAMVRKGIKNDLRSEIDTDAGRFFDLYADNMRRHGTPALPRVFFDEILAVFGDDAEVLTVVDSDGNDLSSVLSFYFRDEVLPYYAGDDVRSRRVAANDFKYWELMRRARLRECRVFDYGRSKVGTGPWSFKKNWGFEPAPLSYEYRLYKLSEIPQKNPLNPKYRAFVSMWRRLPQSVANFLGPRIARQLG